MKFGKLLLPFLVFLTVQLWANHTPIPTEPFAKFSVEKDTCDLPAPSNFEVEGIGQDWVKLKWGPLMIPRELRFRIYRESDNFLLSTTIVPAGITEATIGIPFNTPVYARANYICLDGSHSPNVAETRFHGVILDLLVNGHSAPSSSSSCHITGSGSCNFGMLGTTVFKISLISNGFERASKRFYVEPYFDLVEEQQRYKIQLTTGNTDTNNTFNFFCSPDVVPDCSTGLIVVQYVQPGDDIVVATFDCSQTSSTNELTANLYTGSSDYCRIDRLTNFGGRPAGKDEVFNQHTNFAMPVATTAPNPFSESLTVFLDTFTENVRFQLFNVNGQKVLDQEIADAQDQYSLPTAHLSPGFYFLRIEANNMVQTLKVIKSE